MQAVPSVSVTTGSSLNITGIPGTFDRLMVYCLLSSSVDTGDPLVFLYGTGATPTWLSGGDDYEWRNDVRWTADTTGVIDASVSSGSTSNTAEAQLISGDVNSGLPVQLTMELVNYATSSGANNSGWFKGTYWTGTNGRSMFEGPVHGNVPAAITGLQFSFGGVSSPTITGKCSVDGKIE